MLNSKLSNYLFWNYVVKQIFYDTFSSHLNHTTQLQLHTITVQKVQWGNAMLQSWTKLLKKITPYGKITPRPPDNVETWNCASPPLTAPNIKRWGLRRNISMQKAYNLANPTRYISYSFKLRKSSILREQIFRVFSFFFSQLILSKIVVWMDLKFSTTGYFILMNN